MNRELSYSRESILNNRSVEADIFLGGQASNVVIKSITINVKCLYVGVSADTF